MKDSTHKRSYRPLLLVGVTVGVNLPLVWTILASFGVIPTNIVRPPTWAWPPTGENYAIMLSNPNLIRELVISITIALATTLLAVFVGFLAGYSLARMPFRGKPLLMSGLLVLASFPVISYVIPLRAMMLFTHLYDTFPGIILPETALYAPLAVYVIHGFLARLSTESEESARLDGANLWQILRNVIAPAIAPGLAAIAILIFTLSWNHVLLPMVLSAQHVQTIPVMLSDFFTLERELEWGTAAAALIVSLVPLFVFVAVAYRALEHFSLEIDSDSSSR